MSDLHRSEQASEPVTDDVIDGGTARITHQDLEASGPAVVFMASDEATFITGIELPVDGD